MLDQNTDRTWWMIGALVIGVAIVAAIKLAFPDFVQQVVQQFQTLMNKWLGEVQTGTIVADSLKMFLP
ncbi:hypothetical protein NXK88_002864 [Enterococcus hirae]|uniref:hypothetical protein n=1 Tax=Enterococcus hirae TaxID=1354 RepID=UPI002074442B|nr:hypothetical protein [Enterococcus hirae]EMF0203574.1 hypothetical protein [Enterococcus hirae]